MKTRVILAVVILLVFSTTVDSYNFFPAVYHPAATSRTSDLIRVLRPTLDSEIASVHARYIDACAKKWGISKDLIISIAFSESRFNSCAVSPKGAKGVMQVMDRVHKDKLKARRLAPGEVFYLRNNYDIGCEILYDAKKKHKSLRGILVAYAGGYDSEYVKEVTDSMRKLRASDI